MNKIVRLILIISMCAFSQNVLAQNVSINVDGSAPDASAILDVSDTTKGFLPPRLSTEQMNNISSPANGLLVYNTDSSIYFYYNSSDWISIGSSNLESGELYTSNGNVGIGTNTPDFDLEVAGSEGKQISTINIGTSNTIDDLVISDTANVIRLIGANSDADITGIQAGLDGRIIHLINSTGFEITFKHDDNESVIGNRFQLRDNSDRNMRELQVSSFIYSSLDGGWILMSEH